MDSEDQSWQEDRAHSDCLFGNEYQSRMSMDDWYNEPRTRDYGKIENAAKIVEEKLCGEDYTQWLLRENNRNITSTKNNQRGNNAPHNGSEKSFCCDRSLREDNFHYKEDSSDIMELDDVMTESDPRQKPKGEEPSAHMRKRASKEALSESGDGWCIVHRWSPTDAGCRGARVVLEATPW